MEAGSVRCAHKKSRAKRRSVFQVRTVAISGQVVASACRARPQAAVARASLPFISSRDPRELMNGAPEEIRTPDPQIRSLVLYPAELRARFEGANLFRTLPKGKDKSSQVGTTSRFPASIGGNVQISPRSGIVIPCPLPPRWLRLGAVSAQANCGGRGWAPDLLLAGGGLDVGQRRA
jgi:hypothetical protein